MDIAIASLGFLIAAFCAGVMGYAIQRGATCTVAAVDEVMSKRRFQRLLSMGEASLWVVGGLLIANALGLLGTMPAGYAITFTTVAGGVLLGVGAFVNRACVFGAIARFGSGEWAYVATPIGFYVGCVTFPYLYAAPAAHKLAYGSPVLQASGWVAVLAAAALLARLVSGLWPSGSAGRPLWQRLRDDVATRIWSPHAATTIIGISFFFMLLLVGAWGYTDVLAELARGMSRNLVARSALLLALLAGAIVGGFTAGRFMHTPVTIGRLSRCFAGSVLMAFGSVLIPGGNDGLVLVGIPLLWPYALLAFLTMCLSIALARLLERALSRTISREVPHSGH